MEILNILQCTNLGGMEQSSVRLMKALSPRHSFRVVSVHPFGPLRPVLEQEAIPAQDCPYRGPMGLGSHGALRRLLRAEGLDRPLFMTGPTLTGILALPERRRHPRILMVHFHHQGVHPDWTWRLLYRLALRRFDHVTFPSDFVRDEAVALLPALGSRSSVLRNVLQMPEPRTDSDCIQAREALGLEPDAFVVGNAGWLIPRKRFDVLLETAARVDPKRKIQVLVAGDGELRDSLERQAADLGIAERVRFSGWIRRMDVFYHALDALVFSTDGDAYPTTPLEAMSHGLPVVASAVQSGLKEALVPGTGFLHGDHDVDSMAREIESLYDDPDLRRRFGQAARERIAHLSSPTFSVDPVSRLLAASGAGPGSRR